MSSCRRTGTDMAGGRGRLRRLAAGRGRRAGVRPRGRRRVGRRRAARRARRRTSSGPSPARFSRAGTPRRRDPAGAGQRAHPPADPAVHRSDGGAAADPALVRRLAPPGDRLAAPGGPVRVPGHLRGRPRKRRSPSAPRRWGRSPAPTFPCTPPAPCGRGSSRKGSASPRKSAPMVLELVARSGPPAGRDLRREPARRPRECRPIRCTPWGRSCCAPWAALAASKKLPACLHLAESPAETEFLESGGGEIATRLYPAVGQDVSWFHGIGRPIPAYLAEAGLLREGAAAGA